MVGWPAVSALQSSLVLTCQVCRSCSSASPASCTGPGSMTRHRCCDAPRADWWVYWFAGCAAPSVQCLLHPAGCQPAFVSRQSATQHMNGRAAVQPGQRQCHQQGASRTPGRRPKPCRRSSKLAALSPDAVQLLAYQVLGLDRSIRLLPCVLKPLHCKFALQFCGCSKQKATHSGAEPNPGL